MSLFLITFLSAYGGMHLYALYRLHGTFSPGRPATVLISIWMLFMTLAPLLVRLLERSGMDRSALFIAWPGYLWMGFIFIFASALFALDAIRMAYRLANCLHSCQTPAFLTSPITCEFALMVAIAASCYAFYEARQIRSEHVIIKTSKLSPAIRKVRVVQISDVHVGLLFREERLERVLKVIREAEADIIISTGDLVDGKLNREDVIFHKNSLAAMLASVPAPLGKFAITGNHEVYAGLKEALDFTAAAGFTILRNQSAQLPCGLIITGVDDQAIHGRDSKDQNLENGLLKAASRDAFNILLKHRPEIPAASDGLFDLQLSGHVHGGQIFPFNFMVWLKYRIPCGTTITKSGSRIHISRGTGTWGPPMRLFAPPEVTVIDIVSTSTLPAS